MECPIAVEATGIKIRTEIMQVGKLYSCMYQEKLYLFFKEQNELLNCYEISEKGLLEEVKKHPSVDIEQVLMQYADEHNLGQSSGFD